MAAAGTVFTEAFTTCPLCTPARGTLLTARWPHQTGVVDNYAVGYSQQISMPLTERTWIDEAVRQGFHTGYFGKWHLGPINPEARGAHCFDPHVEAQRLPYDPQTSDFSYATAQERYARESREALIEGRAPFWGDVTKPKEECAPFPVMAQGVRFLEEWAAGDQDQPFFLTLSSAEPHFPHYLPAEYARLARQRETGIQLPPNLHDNCESRPWFHAVPWWPCMDTSVLDEPEWRRVVAYSQAHVTMVDEAIGQVFKALDRLGLWDSTIVVFTSDHGDMEGAHNRFDKGPYFYDEVWRIPLVIRTPEAAPATQDAFVSLMDVGHTLFGLSQANAATMQTRMGRNLMSLVGQATHPSPWPPTVYGVYDRYNGMSFAVRAIRNHRYKYVWNPQAIHELYDLHHDPHEMRNLAGASPYTGVESQLHRQLLTWLADIGDDLPCRMGELPPAGTIMATGHAGP